MNKVDMEHLPVGEMIVIILLRGDIIHRHLSIENGILTLEHTVLTHMLLEITMLLTLTTEMRMDILPLLGILMTMEDMNQLTLIIQELFPVVMPYMHLIEIG